MTSVHGDSELQTDVLDELASAVRYRQWLVSLAAPWVGRDLLEVGSGTGDYIDDWLGVDPQLRLTATEADAGRLDALRRRVQGQPRVDAAELLLPTDQVGAHDAVVAFNVVEHIPDDVAVLRSLGNLVVPGGRVVVFVPAFPIAMSAFDRAIGHVKRYRRSDLRGAVEAAGLEVEVLHYVNSLGLLAWIVGMRLLRGKPSDGPMLRVWDRYVIPVLRWAETRRRPPFGQSVFVVARRAPS